MPAGTAKGVFEHPESERLDACGQGQRGVGGERGLEALEGVCRSIQAEQRLAAEAFVHTATYDVHVASWMGNVLTDTSEGSGFPAWMGATWTKEAVLRYGENPHQSAALYSNGHLPGGPGLAHHGHVVLGVEQCPDPGANHLVIVHQEDAELLHLGRR